MHPGDACKRQCSGTFQSNPQTTDKIRIRVIMSSKNDVDEELHSESTEDKDLGIEDFFRALTIIQM